MKYIAHKDGEREQTVKEHLEGTACLAGEFASKFGKEEWGYCCGMLHDLGKYSKEFQKRIQEDTKDPVDHSMAGAKLCVELGGFYPFMSYCIAGHHAGLPDYGNAGLRSSLKGRLDKKICDYQAYKDEITVPKLCTEPIKVRKDKDPNFSLSVFMRMLYSCLVDADFLDTEYFMKDGKTGREGGDSTEHLLEKLEIHISEWLENTEKETVNGHRTEILKHCLDEGTKRKKGIFRLTVPTGGGKTIASLAFALKHAVEHHMDRIIYVIPCTSIIEQNAQVFREILGDENVLENHCNVEYKDSEELNPMQLASENWDKPVVVTTNVQFFESLFGNKSSKCRKLHNIANSVVILDEAQMLPLDYLKPCMAMLQELTDNYGTSIVLCTATQPSLDRFFEKNKEITELCPRLEEQFQFFERVTYEKLGHISKNELAEYLKDEKSALCIVNTKKMAQELYDKLQGEGVYHLSTSMYPKHRKRVLNNIGERLEEIRSQKDTKKRCIVISTSLVEAGVDLDFTHVYRQIAGIDSVIQAAGRCNREGKADKKESKVYIFDLEDVKTNRNQRQQIDVAKTVLHDHENVADLESIRNYFERLYHNRGESLDKKGILEEFQDYHDFNFAKAAGEFKLIEQENKILLICKEQEAKELLFEIQTKGISKQRMRKVGQYSVQLPVYKNSHSDSLFSKLYDAGMIKVVSEEIEDLYVLIDDEQYSEEKGLNLLLENGMALIR